MRSGLISLSSIMSIEVFQYIDNIEPWIALFFQILIGILTVVYLIFKIKQTKGNKLEFERKGKIVKIWRGKK